MRKLSEHELVNRDAIEFECPRCLNSIRVANDLAGQRIDCPDCKGSLLVPSASVGNDLFDDLFEAPTSDSSPPPSIEKSSNQQQPNKSPADPPAEAESDRGLELDPDEDVLAGVEIPNLATVNDENPLEGKDPFEVDPDATIKIDGVSDLFEHADVYGIKCEICDTRIHVRPDQVGSHVECPECYSKILVTAHDGKNKHTQRWLKENRDKKKYEREDEELKLAAPENLPPIDKSYGFAAPDEDLLAPKQPSSESAGSRDGKNGHEVANDEDNGLELMEEEAPAPKRSTTRREPSGAQSSKVTSPNGASPKISSLPGTGNRKTRRELYEESQRKQAAAEAGTVYQPEISTDEPTESRFPSFEPRALSVAALEMIKSRGVAWRTILAVVLMCFGTIMMQWFFPDSAPIVEKGEEGSMMERLGVWLAWGFGGGVPYLLGIAMLWLTSAYIFRDAALGHRQVKTWKNAGVSELSGTFLIFGFGFFIGGLPALFLTLFTMPLRVLFGPLLLLGAWYSQSPFSIVNVDAFRGVTQNMGHWISFYKFMFLLAAISLVAGTAFLVRAYIPMGPAFVLTAIVSIIGVVILTVVTLVFATVCGWHCGKVVEGLRE